MAKLIVAGDAVAGEVISGKRFSAGINYDAEGNVILPAEDDVKDGVGYGAEGTEFEGTYGGGTADYPAVGKVVDGTLFDNGNLEGTFVVPDESKVENGVSYGADGTEFTGTFSGIPANVITQLDDINGEVIGTTVYDKMDAIEAEKANILAAMNSAGFTAHTDDDLDTYAPYIAVDVIDATRGALDTIAGGTAPDPDDLQHSIWNVSDKMDDVRNEVANMYEVVSVPDNLTGIASEIATSNTSLLTDLNSNLGSVQTDINDAMSQLDADRTAIHDAIEAKGVTVDAEFDDYAAAIANISGGGGATPTRSTAIIRPDSDMVLGGLSQSPGTGNHYEKVNEVNPDDNTVVYKYYLNNDYYDVFGLANTTIPSDSLIESIIVTVRVAQATGGDTHRAILKIGDTLYNGNAVGFAGDTTYRSSSFKWALNPATGASWTVSDINALGAGIQFIGSGGIQWCSQLYVTITYTDIAVDGANTTQTGAQAVVAYDDGSLAKGNSFFVKDNGDGTLSMPNINRMIAKPMNMIDGADAAVNASNTVVSAFTSNYGTFALGTLFTVGQMVGVDPEFGSYVGDWDYGNTPYSQGAYAKDPSTGAVFISLIGSNYDTPAVTPHVDPAYQSWQLVKSHANIYVCKTEHTSAAEPTAWEWTPGINYSVGDKRTYNDGMGGLYWECNTAYQTPNGAFYEDTAYWTDITAATIAAAFISANWHEVTNMACPMALGIPIARKVTDHCTYADGLSYAGYSDWRMANIRELMEMMHFGNPASASPLYGIPALGTGSKSIHSSTPAPDGITTRNMITDFGSMYPLYQGYRENWGYTIFVRDIE
jgi:hypothetical protein